MDDTPPRDTPLRPVNTGRARHRHPERLPTPSAPASVFVCGWLLAAASVAIFLAAGPAQGSLGVFLVGAGAVLTFLPARARVEWPLWIAVGGLLICASLAFLPAGWFPLPEWRAALGNAPGIHLPATVTPVPWETGFWLAVLAVSCVTGLFVLAHPIRSRATFGVALAAVIVCGVYAALSIYARRTGWHYPFSGGATFGFFPNRNHTAVFLVTGSITALGVVTISLREGRWILGTLSGACLAACVAGLFFYSGSRGGVVFLVIGTLIWVAGLRGTHRNVPLLVSVVVLVVASGVLFLVSGGEARARLFGKNEAKVSAKPTGTTAAEHAPAEPQTGEDHDTPLDFRMLIYRDTAVVIREAPVSGTGLGAFAPVFAQYRRASLSGSVAIHPESDWLMLTAEAGIPALVCAVLAVGLLLLRLRGAHEHPFWPLRWGCAAAAATALLHGVVDVPTHRVALGWWILLLAALGLQTGRSRTEKSSSVQRVLFVLGGLGALVLGVQLIRAEWFGAAPLPPFAAGKAREEIVALADRADAVAALERAQTAVGTTPLSAPLYYQLGVLLLRFEDSDAEADRAFAVQRTLNPNWPNVPLVQGDAWITIDPKRTVALWLEALDRQTRIDHAITPKSEGPDGYYRSLLVRAGQQPEIQRGLAVAATRSPKFLLAWLDAAPSSMVREQLPAFAKEATLLNLFPAPQREKFLLTWYTKGDREALSGFLSEHPEWQPAAWDLKLRQSLADHQFETVVRDTTARYHVSLALPDVVGPEDRRETAEIPVNDPVQMFETYWRNGNAVSARRALAEATSATDGAVINPELWRLKAALAVRDEAWSDAWDNLSRYLRSSGQDPAIP